MIAINQILCCSSLISIGVSAFKQYNIQVGFHFVLLRWYLLTFLFSNRDLKLDNILLKSNGYIKLADYGLCKLKTGYGEKTNTFCGTPEFMAPEIIEGASYSKSVDWWAFGVLIYELVLGRSPFNGYTDQEIFESILKGNVSYPLSMNLEAHSIIKRLLHPDPDKRLGAGIKDALEVKSHPFFRDISWDLLIEQKTLPFYIPKLVRRF